MPNPVKGEVPLKLNDGREFVLVLDFEALVEAETVYGKPLAQIMADAATGFVGAFRALLYGALRAKHPAITPREASEMFIKHTDAVKGALEKAALAAFPAAAEGKDGKNPQPKPRRGKTSGGSGTK